MKFPRIISLSLILSLAVMSIACNSEKSDPSAAYRSVFAVDKTKLVNSGASRYFVLEPGYRLHFKHGEDKLTITVLAETKLVDGVQTRVIEEREEENGALAEISRNYFAMDPATQDVYYFGEDVDIYKDGKITSHSGSWLSGENNARFGLFMPGSPKVGDKFQQEISPGQAQDRSEITSVTATITTPAGKFEQCVEISETSPLEKGTSHKVFAPGVGLVRDDEYELVKIEKPTR